MTEQEIDYGFFQIDWIRENRVWDGAKVRVIREFSAHDEGCKCLGTDSIIDPDKVVGSIFTVRNVVPNGINLLGAKVKRPDGSIIDWFTAPYSALEVVEPYNGEKDFGTICDGVLHEYRHCLENFCKPDN